MSRRFSEEPEAHLTPRPEDLTAELSTELSTLTFERFAIEVVEGPDMGRRIECEGDELSIGSAQGNTLRLTDRAASRHHCAITSTPKGFFLRDLDSTNGVRLEGYRVGAAYLKHEARFTVGRSTLCLQNLDEKVVAELSAERNFATMLGESAAMRRIFALLPRVAQSESTVVIEGETGTGKTLLASAIHDASARATGPFVVVDCGAMTPTLIESQLFGHARGAFTGATDDRSGAFVAAKGGTLFLDEIGELPLEVQPKLLRVLEERVVTPLGETRAVPVDVRIVAATNRDLRAEVNQHQFRADLFYRLHVVSFRILPLRERPEDIPLLAAHFAGDTPIPDGVLEEWQRRHWGGNVRELRSAITRLQLLGTELEGEAGDVAPAPVDLQVPFRAAKELATRSFEKRYLAALIQEHQGNITRAARAASMDRNHLRELLRKHELVERK